jgi:hypothetical protein
LTTYFHNYIGVSTIKRLLKLIKWWSENSTNTAIYIETEVIKSIPIQIKWNIPSEILIRLTWPEPIKHRMLLVPNRLLIETKR